MSRPRAADDFVTIRARLKELRREREAAQAPASDLLPDQPQRYAKYGYGSQREISAAPRTSPTASRDARLEQLAKARQLKAMLAPYPSEAMTCWPLRRSDWQTHEQ